MGRGVLEVERGSLRSIPKPKKMVLVKKNFGKFRLILTIWYTLNKNIYKAHGRSPQMGEHGAVAQRGPSLVRSFLRYT